MGQIFPRLEVRWYNQPVEHHNLPSSDAPMIIFSVRKSQWFLIGPLVFLGLGAFLLIAILILANPGESVNVLIQVAIFFVGVLGFSVGALIIWLDWSSTRYVLTTQTIEKVSGFVTQNKTYMSLHDLSKIESRRGILGQMFNFGTVMVESETSERPLFLPGVSDPYEVINLIRSTRAHVAGTDL